MAKQPIRSLVASRQARVRGRKAEREALKFLRKQGLHLITSNFHCRFGEIDLVMKNGTALVIVEVRFRASDRFATAENSIDRHKQAKLIRTTAMFLSRHQEYANFAVRFDVVALNQVSEHKCELQWIKDAFRPA